ncbi:hypothetical protein [Myxococcus sp. SDU36]|uniref:hypothetical protein n=1 Tax=Myxococcus sp. SDU36 TaxID=2831967 RepID=UPI0025431C0C|nr:hypothetical protein [Myxococcus sp. SDU36]WIG93887.1 hypothetical protein KGD87_25400 [Myxococcus sp. SDU36]
MTDSRDSRGTRHEHLGLLGLVVAGSAAGKKGLKQATQMAGMWERGRASGCSR